MEQIDQFPQTNIDFHKKATSDIYKKIDLDFKYPKPVNEWVNLAEVWQNITIEEGLPSDVLIQIKYHLMPFTYRHEFFKLFIVASASKTAIATLVS